MMQMQMQPINRTANHQPYYHHAHSQSGIHCGSSATCTTSTAGAATALINTYELEVGETDFAQLRRDQALLGDFGSFADSFISLLGYCDLGQQREEDEEEQQQEKQRTNQPSQTQNQTQNRTTPADATEAARTCRMS